MSLETSYSDAGEALRKAVNEKGPDIIQAMDSVEKYLKQGKCEQTVICQVLLFLQTSNIARYIPQTKTGISMIDVNNIICRTEFVSGLNRDTVKKLFIVVLYALSLPTALETATIPTATGMRSDDRIIEPNEEYEEKLSIIRKAILNRDLETLTPLLPDLNRMADNGYAEALYQKGLCYYNACGTEENIPEAMKCFSIAAHNGSINAYAALGDCYFQSATPDYTKAFECYTALGAIANSAKRQENIKIILEERALNIKLLITNFFLVTLLFVFNIFLAKGTFSAYGQKHIFAAVISIFLTLAAFALAVVSFIKRRFNSIQWVTPTIFLLAMICVFFAI